MGGPRLSPASMRARGSGVFGADVGRGRVGDSGEVVGGFGVRGGVAGPVWVTAGGRVAGAGTKSRISSGFSELTAGGVAERRSAAARSAP